jgi:hypothetical protein
MPEKGIRNNEKEEEEALEYAVKNQIEVLRVVKLPP